MLQQSIDNCSNFRDMNRHRDKDILLKLGNNLRQIRKSKNLSQEELANKADIQRSQVARIERGEINPTITTLVIIAEVLEIEVQSLLLSG